MDCAQLDFLGPEMLTLASRALSPPLKWGGRQDLARASRATAMARALSPQVGGAVLRRPGHGLRTTTQTRPAERRERATDELYSWLQQGLHIDLPMASNEDLFHNIGPPQSAHPEGQEAASLVIFWNRTSYNDSARHQKSGEFNTPGVRTRRSPNEHDFSRYQSALQDWCFTATDFQAVRLKLLTSSMRTAYDGGWDEYTKDRFPWRDQSAPAEWLAAHSAPVFCRKGDAKNRRPLPASRLRAGISSGPRRISCKGDAPEPSGKCWLTEREGAGKVTG